MGSFHHSPNVVTAVLASCGGFGTFGETVVVVTAGLGVRGLLAGKTRTGWRRRDQDADSSGVKGDGDA